MITSANIGLTFLTLCVPRFFTVAAKDVYIRPRYATLAAKDVYIRQRYASLEAKDVYIRHF